MTDEYHELYRELRFAHDLITWAANEPRPEHQIKKSVGLFGNPRKWTDPYEAWQEEFARLLEGTVLASLGGYFEWAGYDRKTKQMRYEFDPISVNETNALDADLDDDNLMEEGMPFILDKVAEGTTNSLENAIHDFSSLVSRAPILLQTHMKPYSLPGIIVAASRLSAQGGSDTVAFGKKYSVSHHYSDEDITKWFANLAFAIEVLTALLELGLDIPEIERLDNPTFSKNVHGLIKTISSEEIESVRKSFSSNIFESDGDYTSVVKFIERFLLSCFIERRKTNFKPIPLTKAQLTAKRQSPTGTVFNIVLESQENKGFVLSIRLEKDASGQLGRGNVISFGLKRIDNARSWVDIFTKIEMTENLVDRKPLIEKRKALETEMGRLSVTRYLGDEREREESVVPDHIRALVDFGMMTYIGLEWFGIVSGDDRTVSSDFGMSTEIDAALEGTGSSSSESALDDFFDI